MDYSFLHSKKLLLVDDEPELLKMVTAILTDEGFQRLVTAANMKKGIAAAKAEKPDLAILDVMLPDGDGFSLMEQIRTWTDIPVIFLTARDEAADKLAGLGLGADDYIAKPFLPQEFLLRVYAVLLFLVYYFSKRKISKNTEPIMASIKTLSTGKPVDLSIRGELSEIADSVNQASQVLSRQNQARANWISGVSHDIRTPLSMIMGYAQRIAGDHGASGNIQQEVEIIQAQGAKIKDLVQDLNLVSQLEYEMQPLHKEPVRLSKLLRSYAADLLNAGIGEKYSFVVEISPEAEPTVMECDARLISRAIGNLVQNSINHNPQGCDIFLSLDCLSENISITVTDNGIGMSVEKLRELEEKPHYMESTDERLDLRHGLGLLLVRQIVEAHSGIMKITNRVEGGVETALVFIGV